MVMRLSIKKQNQSLDVIWWHGPEVLVLDLRGGTKDNYEDQKQNLLILHGQNI